MATYCKTNAELDAIALGIRQGVLIETTRDAAGAFEKHQFLIKLTWRGDCNATRRDAFWRLVGVTS